MDAFKSNFDFCEYYFFSSVFSTFIKNRQFDSVFFLGPDLKIDKNIKPKISKFFIAEYSPIESDTDTYYSGTSTVRGANGLEKQDNYYTSGSFGFEALIIRNDKFIQLAKPFPYYVKTWGSLRKPTKVIKKMNKKLNKYYNIVN